MSSNVSDNVEKTPLKIPQVFVTAAGGASEPSTVKREELSPPNQDGQSPKLLQPAVKILRRVSSGTILTPKEKQEVKSFFRKPRKLTGLALFILMLSRAIWLYIREERLMSDLMQAFDMTHDERLSTAEMKDLLKTNGVEFTSEQVKLLFGRVDDEGDGYDLEEVQRIVSIIAGFPAVSERVRIAAETKRTVIVDIFICIVTGCGLAYIIGQSDTLEKKWAASRFANAVNFRRMQSRCSDLDKRLASITVEREKLEGEIAQLEENNNAANVDEQNAELKKLRARLTDVYQRQETAQNNLESEVQRWQTEAEKCMREATLARSKMRGVMNCLKGLDSFTGTSIGKFEQQGAQPGFCNNAMSSPIHPAICSQKGFSMDSITFGTIENGQLIMFETSPHRKLGEGKDCAYRCTDLSNGTEAALKMYSIGNRSKKIAIRNDLLAHRAQIGKHPRIVSYERVIETESTIFVLMELIDGMDLFDVVATRGLTEREARPLFLQLTEAIQHLHKRNIIHCDVKPENAMVTGNVDNNTANLKLIDFGCSCFKEAGIGQSNAGCVVYDAYMPPELACDPHLMPAVATDMWRLGCTLYVMLCRRPPFLNDAVSENGQRIRMTNKYCKSAPWPNLSSEAKSLIVSLLNSDPSGRPTTEKVLNHPWLRAEIQ